MTVRPIIASHRRQRVRIALFLPHSDRHIHRTNSASKDAGVGVFEIEEQDMNHYTSTRSGVREGQMTLSGPTITRRQAIAGAAALAALAPIGALAESHAGDFAAGEMAVGSKDAPITIMEFASMTCPHCKSFHETTWPELKANWIDTGKVRFIFREFPFDRPGLAAAMLARCGGEQRFYGFIDVLFAQQARWSRSRDPMAELRTIAALGGVNGEKFDQCMTNPALEEVVLNSRLEAHQKFEVNSTPTLIINGEKYEGSHDYDTLNDHLESLG
jgi:glutaredoxin